VGLESPEFRLAQLEYDGVGACDFRQCRSRNTTVNSASEVVQLPEIGAVKLHRKYAPADLTLAFAALALPQGVRASS
jgi:hypothetical protein